MIMVGVPFLSTTSYEKIRRQRRVLTQKFLFRLLQRRPDARAALWAPLGLVRNEGHDDALHHDPAVVPQIGGRISQPVSPAWKKLVITALHDSFLILVVQV